MMLENPPDVTTVSISKTYPKLVEVISILHEYEVWTQNLSQESWFVITRLAKLCQTVIPSDRFFFSHLMLLIHTFSCIFILQQLIVNIELLKKV